MITKIEYDTFIRSWQILPANSMNVLLGAGASISSGIPTGWMLMWEFKKKIYLSQNKHVREEKFKDLESESNQKILQEYFNTHEGYPKFGDPLEYSFYFEKCFPQAIHRQFYIQELIKDKKPALGYLCLGGLINSGHIKHIWSTNFDDLVEKGVSRIDHSKSFACYSPETIGKYVQLNFSDPCVMKLHGDFRYDFLQNTVAETSAMALEKQLHQEFVEQHKKKGLIVIGYSGSDDSIKNVISESINSDNPFPLGLIWCIRKGETPKPEVIELVNKANSKNKNSGFLEIENFDDFLYQLYVGKKLKNEEVDKIAEALFEKRQPFKAKQATPQSFAPLKLNCFKIISIPKNIYSSQTKIKTWKELNAFKEGKDMIVAPSRGKTYFFGDLEKIKGYCKEILEKEIEIEDVKNEWLRNEDSFFKSMLYDLIEAALKEKLGLICTRKKSGTKKFYSPSHTIATDNSNYVTFEAIEIQLNYLNDQLWINLMPCVEAISKRQPENRLSKQALANKILSQRYNQQYNGTLKFWNDLFTQAFGSPMELKYFGFSIQVNALNAFAGAKINEKITSFEGAFNLVEPKLKFNLSDNNYSTIHPLKGLKDFYPLDYSFTTDHNLKSTLKLAIISPDDKFDLLIKQLNLLKSNVPIKSEREYLIDYPGFDTVYQKYIDFPVSSTSELCSLIKSSEVSSMNIQQFYDLIKRKIDYFDSIKGDFNLIILYIPKAWERFREQKTDNFYFDLHDSVKLYCAKKHIKVQFIEEKSLNYFDQSKVQWWLSLGLYTKSNGIPWMLEASNDSSAYVGLGFAIKKTATKNKVVMGCSQIFDSTGQGLRFMLQPLNNPVIRGKNPFMSKEDARRIMLKLRESYNRLDTNGKLEKIVIHKTTYFTRDEMEGIGQALEGVPQIELLQIQELHSWRGIQGAYDASGKPIIHSYPVKRGTTVQLDNHSFLLWTHGNVTDSSLNGANYYQGKRGIPAPLLVKRFRGFDSIETTANEILSLTKMNWNGGELYKKTPVTLEFSKRLSQMSKQDEQLNNTPYDFRFFI
ncbi:MAG: SIR2 family protein [Bacteroidetes bacterium]|nr:SIR2 family protein [Bacteroidota bacterium]